MLKVSNNQQNPNQMNLVWLSQTEKYNDSLQQEWSTWSTSTSKPTVLAHVDVGINSFTLKPIWTSAVYGFTKNYTNIRCRIHGPRDQTLHDQDYEEASAIYLSDTKTT